MPIYEYKCTNGHIFEVIQSMSDDPVTACEVCGAQVERVFHPVAVHFKGSGFYSTDYAGKGKAAAAASGSDGDMRGRSAGEAEERPVDRGDKGKSKAGESSGSDKGSGTDSAKAGEKSKAT